MKFVINTLTEKFLCSELKVKEYKELLKCTFGETPDKQIFCETLCEVLNKITGLSDQRLKEMSVVDVLLMVLQIKINCQGNIVNVIVTKDEKQMTLTLDLNYVISSIQELYNSLRFTEINVQNIKILLKIPSLARLLDFQDEEYLCFFDKAIINDKELIINTNSEASLLFDKLPPAVSLEILNRIQAFGIECNKTNFLDKYQVSESLSFFPSLESLLWYTKLIFHESLDTFYSNLFYLSYTGHINLDYIENLTPGEYLFMTKKLEAALNAKTSNLSQHEEIDDSGIFEDGE